jgi:virulence-associated protein VagC
MAITTIFTNNRTQAVRLPAELRLPETVKKVDVRARGNERIISPIPDSKPQICKQQLFCKIGMDFDAALQRSRPLACNLELTIDLEPASRLTLSRYLA